MGNCLTSLSELESRTDEQALNRSRQIDRQLKEDSIKMLTEREIKILLLGAGELVDSVVCRLTSVLALNLPSCFDSHQIGKDHCLEADANHS